MPPLYFPGKLLSRARGGLSVPSEPILQWGEGVSIGNKATSANWLETSGICPARRSENLGKYFLASDGSVPYLLCAGADASDQGELLLDTNPGAGSADFEDIASAVIGGQPYVYMADIGDNGSARATFYIHRIKEPVITGSDFGLTAGVDYDIITCQLSDAPTHKDKETLIVDPDTGDMYLITKRVTTNRLYKLAHQDFGAYSGTQSFVFQGTIFTPSFFTAPSDNAANGGYCVGGSISSDGTLIIIKDYEFVYLFQRNPATQTILEALQGTPTVIYSYVMGGRPFNTSAGSTMIGEPQGEALCFSHDDQDIVTTSEYQSGHQSSASNYPIFRYPRRTQRVTEVILRQGLNGYSGCVDTYIDNTVPASNYSAETTMFADFNAASQERVAFIKFDLSSIPASATIVGAELIFTIANEGQFLEWRPLLDGWVWDSSLNYSTYSRIPAFNDVDAPTAYWFRSGNWDTVGANVAGQPIVRTLKLDLDLIQDWVDGTRVNNGWTIYQNPSDGSSGDGTQINSSENTTEINRPTLVVRYY